MSTTPSKAKIGKPAASASVPQVGTAAQLQALPDPLCTTPLTSTYYNTLIDPATVTYYNYRKDGHFALSYLELKNMGNIKEIKEIKEDISKKLRKEKP